MFQDAVWNFSTNFRNWTQFQPTNTMDELSEDSFDGESQLTMGDINPVYTLGTQGVQKTMQYSERPIRFKYWRIHFGTDTGIADDLLEIIAREIPPTLTAKNTFFSSNSTQCWGGGVCIYYNSSHNGGKGALLGEVNNTMAWCMNSSGLYNVGELPNGEC